MLGLGPETWVYPTNLGNIHNYQYNIVAKGLYHNLLIALPIDLGKTFIAATVMLNWFDGPDHPCSPHETILF